MPVLTSFGEALRILDISCDSSTLCEDRVMSSNYGKSIRRKENLVVFSCNFCGDESRYSLGFQLTPEIRAGLEKEVQDLLLQLGGVKDFSLGRQFSSKSDELIRKLRVYALLHNPDEVEELRGYCLYCFQQAPMIIREQRLFISCSPCASIIADSAD